MDISGVPTTLTGLSMLMQDSIWQNVNTMASDLLSEEGNLDDPDTQRVVSVIKFLSLFKLKQYDKLVTDVIEFLKVFEATCDAAQSADVIVPLRMLLSEAKIMTGRSHEAFDELQLLKLELEASDISLSNSFWIWQLDCHVINGYVRLRNWKAAISALKGTILDIGKQLEHEANQSSKEHHAFLVKSQTILLTRLSRILLQVGSARSSLYYFQKAKELYADHVKNTNSSPDLEVQQHFYLLQGLLSFGEEHYEVAMGEFEKVLELAELHKERKEDGAVAASSSETTELGILQRAIKETIEPAECESVVGAATNNFAICSLYMKKIKMATAKLEELIQKDPPKYMVDPVVFNLCTLYDVSYAPDISTMKKKTLQQVAANFSIVDPVLHWRSFLLS